MFWPKLEVPCEIHRTGNRVTVLFESRKEVVELDLTNEADVIVMDKYTSLIGKKK